jgi:hypothetical protein
VLFGRTVTELRRAQIRPLWSAEPAHEVLSSLESRFEHEWPWRNRLGPSAAAVLVGVIAACAIGLFSSHLQAIPIALLSLLPVFAHVRHVGLRRALTEPTPAAFIVAFYVLVFPLRGLVMAASHYTDVLFGHSAVTARDLENVLALASIGTTLLIEGYYFTAGRKYPVATPSRLRAEVLPCPMQVVRLAGLLAFIALVGLVLVISRYGGIGGAQAALLSHAKGPLSSDTNPADSAWQLFAGPAVWCAAYVAANRATVGTLRLLFGGVAVVILAAMFVVYGSRLNATLALVGAWIVFHYSGGRVSVPLVLAIVPLFALLSLAVLSSRETTPAPRLPLIERYSRIAAYGVLDVSLAVSQEATTLRHDLSAPNRWLDLPGYLVPSALWHGRPDINARRLDVYVARAIGNQNDLNTGFPPTYLMEDWLLGGWPLLLVMSALGGIALGWLDKKLVGQGANLTAGRLFAYCFLVTAAFGYYKDGDILTSTVGDVRTALYLGVLLAVTGAWSVRLTSPPQRGADRGGSAPVTRPSGAVGAA